MPLLASECCAARRRSSFAWRSSCTIPFPAYRPQVSVRRVRRYCSERRAPPSRTISDNGRPTLRAGWQGGARCRVAEGTGDQRRSFFGGQIVSSAQALTPKMVKLETMNPFPGSPRRRLWGKGASSGVSRGNSNGMGTGGCRGEEEERRGDDAPASVCFRNHGQVKCMVVQVRSPYLRGAPTAVCDARLGVSGRAFGR